MSTIHFGIEEVGLAAEYWASFHTYNTTLPECLETWENEQWFHRFVDGLAEFCGANARAYTARYREPTEAITAADILAHLHGTPVRCGFMRDSLHGKRTHTAARYLAILGQYNCDDEALSAQALGALLELSRCLILESEGEANV
jgi:hypothetical protein